MSTRWEFLGWELLTGAPPFLGPTVEAICKDHEKTPLPSLRTRRPEAAPALAELLAEMVAKQPADRPPQMSEVARRLRALTSPAAQGREQRAPRILIVEDEVATQKVLDFFVRKVAPRAEVRLAGRSSEALQILRSFSPDLILLDPNWPDGTGLELCLHLRSLGLAERCRIVPGVSAAPGYDRSQIAAPAWPDPDGAKRSGRARSDRRGGSRDRTPPWSRALTS